MVANYQEKGWDTADKVFKRKLEESLKVMNTQGTLAGYRTTEDFVNELQKHLKITKVCKNDDILSCFEDKVMFGAGTADPEEVDMSTVKTASHFGQKKWKTNVVGLQLNNGTNALIAYNPECRQDPYSNQITGSDCVAILYDTSGYSKPNTSGKDLRAINVTSLGSKCAFEINGTCYGAPFFPTPMTLYECLEQKDDLGLTNCDYNTNYWAGAVKQCGGRFKLPSMEQLSEIANYIYNTDKIQSDITFSNLTRDDELASSLGFSVTSGEIFYVWSSASFPGCYYAVRKFGATKIETYGPSCKTNFIQAVCVID